MYNLINSKMFWNKFDIKCISYFSVPPQKPLIMDERGRQVEGQGSVGPFREGDSISLECHVPGGKILSHARYTSVDVRSLHI